jgi:pimeloyl-ACP methyl ester carboxylesterase
MKTVLFVPGFKENFASHDYAKLFAAIERKGYQTQFVPINWQRTVVDDWVAQLEAVYAAFDPKQTILAGFSQGAVTALHAAANRPPFELWLCSLSPYFAEDMPSITRTSWLHYIGKRRAERFWRMPFAPLAPKITCPTRLFVGEHEHALVQSRSRRAAILLPHATLHIAPLASHDPTSRGYLEIIASAIAG